jgi:hypothetical protein
VLGSVRVSHVRKLAVGLGYVGLPVAVAFARQGTPVIGFDVDADRIAELKTGHDRTREVETRDLALSSLRLTADAAHIAAADFFIVAAPTPLDNARRPDLTALIGASQTDRRSGSQAPPDRQRRQYQRGGRPCRRNWRYPTLLLAAETRELCRAQSASAPIRSCLAQHGRIGKRGRCHARAILVEAAWAAAKAPGPLRSFFLRIRARRGHQVAAVAVARKLAVLCWNLLTKDADYQ